MQATSCFEGVASIAACCAFVALAERPASADVSAAAAAVVVVGWHSVVEVLQNLWPTLVNSGTAVVLTVGRVSLAATRVDLEVC